MGNNGVKSIVLVAILVIMSFFVGGQISDSKTTSLGVVAAVAGGFTLLYMGKNAWWLIFLAPPVIEMLHIRAPFSLPAVMLIAPGILFYWILMWIMGYVRIKWRSLPVLDALMCILFIYLCVSFYRRPVAFLALGLDMDDIGGKEYVIFLLSFLSYISLSCIPVNFKQSQKLLKYLFWFTMAAALFGLVVSVATGRGGGGEEQDLADAAENSRFSLLAPIGTLISVYLYASTPLTKIFTRTYKLLTILLGACCVVIAGWRGRLIEFCFRFAFIAALKRELTALVIIALGCYGSLLYLSEEHLLEGLPYGVQRALCAVPGVNVRKDIQRNAEGSSEWRIVMWKWALDPRTGYIRDYIWGDGFGQSKSDIQRTLTATMRGTRSGGDQRDFASRGVWHSGWISTMHRLGIVGLVIVVLWQLSAMVICMMTAVAYKRVSKSCFSYFCALYITVCSSIIQFHLSAGTPEGFFRTISTYAILKMFYCICSEERLIVPFFRFTPYIPLTIRAIENDDAPRSIR